MPAVHLAIAAIPIAVYFILIGALRLRRHPLVTTGWRDTLTLGIALSGLVAVGPMQLFFPSDAAALWHGWVWLALMSLYLLSLLMIMLNCKPRLIAYGMNESQFRESLLSAAQAVDPGAHWDSDILDMPTCKIQLALDPSGSARVYQVVHVGMLQNVQDWIALERAFVKTGALQTCPRSAAGLPLAFAGSLLLLYTLIPLITNPSEALAQLKDFLAR